MEIKEEEFQSAKTKLEVYEAEISAKDNTLEMLKEENEQLQEKNKKWINKLDQEIEKNS